MSENLHPIPSKLPQDPASASNPHRYLTGHYSLNWGVDFDSQEIRGVVHIGVQVPPDVDAQSDKTLVLDSHKLNIKSVEVESVSKDAGADADKFAVPQELPFEVKEFTNFGSALHVDLSKVPQQPGSSFVVRIVYTAGNDGPAICWLKPVQTAGKKHPYLFTQGQACLNRSLFPCQDTPAVRITYDACVAVPKHLVAVMSAKSLNKFEGDVPVGESVPEELVPLWSTDKTQQDALRETHHAFRFGLPSNVSIPSYLVALAVGDLVSTSVGPRSRLWTEPSELSSAEAEFSGHVEIYLHTAERLFGKYRWEEYNLLVMPPCFPFGGMENPMLTFVTPCLVCGDRSLADVIVHEISHSWFGNLVTNASWSEFWLNEGFTMYAQRRITEEVHGVPFTALEAKTGRQLLKEEIENLGEDNMLTRLRVPIEHGIDPEDTYNETPYEKGFAFVSYLAFLAGKSNFDEFLRTYLDTYAFKSIVAEHLFNSYFDHFPHLKTDARLQEFSVWLTQPGWPTFLPDLSAADELTKPANELVSQWRSLSQAIKLNSTPDFDAPSKEPEPKQRRTALLQQISNVESKLDDNSKKLLKTLQEANVASWPTYQKMYFLDLLQSYPKKDNSDEAGVFVELNASALALMDSAYAFGECTNAEIRQRWGTLCIRSSYHGAYPSVEEFLRSQGKQKYTLAIYRALMSGDQAAHELAKSMYEETKDTLHVNVRNYVRKIIAGESSHGSA